MPILRPPVPAFAQGVKHERGAAQRLGAALEHELRATFGDAAKTGVDRLHAGAALYAIALNGERWM
jgi:hypothetical protein